MSILLPMNIILSIVKEYNKDCFKVGYFKCRGACIENRYVCDGVSNCANGEDEDPALCKLQIQTWTTNSTKKHTETQEFGRRWSIFCVARYEDQITWYKKKQNHNDHINLTLKANCNSDCKYETKQTVWPGDKAVYVSELHIKSLRYADSGSYTCRMSHLRSQPFSLRLKIGRIASLTVETSAPTTISYDLITPLGSVSFTTGDWLTAPLDHQPSRTSSAMGFVLLSGSIAHTI
ncbi:hypothetical protein ElyMa_002495800 [Elysia marginata]|uniref:Ig-like domain-containing protein n=1 Tax=Elysia marginata TaxID=1093978 RepID=A0AAV4GPS8_9GAST|nr:hypothetical protein ElyMa_002495800 [Elysia marginata]